MSEDMQGQGHRLSILGETSAGRSRIDGVHLRKPTDNTDSTSLRANWAA
jgi:hypothetical protein